MADSALAAALARFAREIEQRRSVARLSEGAAAGLLRMPARSEDCGVCGGGGWLLSAAPYGSDGYGTVRPCACRFGGEERGGSGTRGGETFDALYQGNRTDRAAIVAAREWVYADGGWLAIVGDGGSGRSALCRALVNELTKLGRRATYAAAPLWLERMRGANGSAAAEAFAGLRDVEVAVIDDVPADDSLTGWGRDRLWTLARFRESEGLVTALAFSPPEAGIDPRLLGLLESEDARFVRVRSEVKVDPLYEKLAETMTFDTYVADGSRPKTEDALEKALRFAGDPKGTLLLMGPPGVGKTHLAIAVCERLRASGRDVWFVRVSDFIDSLRPPNEGGEPMRHAVEADLLVLDDLGSESDTAWAQGKLLQVIDRRLIAGGPLVVTTNLDIAGSGGRIGSRLNAKGVASGVWIDGADYRRLGRPRRRRRR